MYRVIAKDQEGEFTILGNTKTLTEAKLIKNDAKMSYEYYGNVCNDTASKNVELWIEDKEGKRVS